MTMNIKVKILLLSITILLALSALLLIGYDEREKEENSKFELQTFKTDEGWGYNILLNKKILISQPNIPAIDTVMPFPSEESAKRTGQLVLEKIVNKENFSVSKQEVEYSLSY